MRCPNCRVEMEFEDEEKRGKIFICPECGREEIVKKGRIVVPYPGLVPAGCLDLEPLEQG